MKFYVPWRQNVALEYQFKVLFKALSNHTMVCSKELAWFYLMCPYNYEGGKTGALFFNIRYLSFMYCKYSWTSVMILDFFLPYIFCSEIFKGKDLDCIKNGSLWCLEICNCNVCEFLPFKENMISALKMPCFFFPYVFFFLTLFRG